jgi:hypothetical protein
MTMLDLMFVSNSFAYQLVNGITLGLAHSDLIKRLPLYINIMEASYQVLVLLPLAPEYSKLNFSPNNSSVQIITQMHTG